MREELDEMRAEAIEEWKSGRAYRRARRRHLRRLVRDAASRREEAGR
jgi:hypothetical protein